MRLHYVINYTRKVDLCYLGPRSSSFGGVIAFFTRGKIFVWLENLASPDFLKPRQAVIRSARAILRSMTP
jgi:hypothetical protein